MWPGPLTLIVRNKKGISEAFRVPDDKYLLEILKITAKPLVSTSVNFTGKLPINKIDIIIDQFEPLVDAILDGGDTGEAALPSTILDVRSNQYKIIRQGACSVPDSLLE